MAGDKMNTLRHAKIHAGDSALTRDLVWCQCGRGISLSGIWSYCPNCGRRIDQYSYLAAVKVAQKNGAVPYRDAESIEEIARLSKELNEARQQRDHVMLSEADLLDRLNGHRSFPAYYSHTWKSEKQMTDYGSGTEYVTVCKECGYEDRGSPAEFPELKYPFCHGLEDTEIVNWIEEFIQTGVITTAFELDGGIHLTVATVGNDKEIAYREQNSFREAVRNHWKIFPDKGRLA
jgi:hypothetical protein